MLRWFLKFFTISFFIIGLSIPAITFMGFTGTYLYMAPDLPNTQELAGAKLQMPLHIYSMDGQLMGVYGSKHRQTVEYNEVPEQLLQAFLAAEDDRFFEHKGVDAKGLGRAILSYVDKSRPQSGGSTITMQLAKIFFLSQEKTVLRKLKQIFLAWNIEQHHSKEEIFQLYLNKIFLGKRAYGVATAAKTYYGKSLDMLSLPQYAMIAGLPKAPSENNPISNPENAKIRRDWILKRMYQLGFIDYVNLLNAQEQPITAKLHKNNRHQIDESFAYPAEMARQEAFKKYGEALYTDGYTIYTSINTGLQKFAEQSIITGLNEYDKRHGYRGAERNISDPGKWSNELDNMKVIHGLRPAIVTSLQSKSVDIKLQNGKYAKLKWSQGIKQTRRYISEDKISGYPNRVSDLFKVGDVIRVAKKNGEWYLRQIPKAQAAIVAMAPQNGHILALYGGFHFNASKFNRAAQAKRQPGSTLKPLIYAAAMELDGFTPASVIKDEPKEFLTARGKWKPMNASGRFYGPTRLRKALYYSRNIVTISLLETVGIRDFINYLGRFGFDTAKLPYDLSLALGSNSMTPLEVTNNYSDIANGGYHVTPTLITRIDKHDKAVYYANAPVSCFTCTNYYSQFEVLAKRQFEQQPTTQTTFLDSISFPAAKQAPRAMDDRVNYIVNDILKDVIREGTAKDALELEREDLAGKTGTTNGPVDAWFAGYHPDLAVTTWLGFDRNEKLGKKEFGGSAALPIWMDFMENALEGVPEKKLPEPIGISRVNINPHSGKVLTHKTANSLVELFRTEKIEYPKESIAMQEIMNEFSDIQINIPIFDTRTQEFIDTEDTSGNKKRKNKKNIKETEVEIIDTRDISTLNNTLNEASQVLDTEIIRDSF